MCFRGRVSAREFVPVIFGNVFFYGRNSTRVTHTLAQLTVPYPASASNYRLSRVSWRAYTWRARRNIERALWPDRFDPVTTERTIGRDSYLAYLVISDHKNEHKPTRFVR